MRLPRRLASLAAITSFVALAASSALVACSAAPDGSEFQGDGRTARSAKVDGGSEISFGDTPAVDTLTAGCATASASAERRAVTMLMVLDGSGSMDQQEKWNATVPALSEVFDSLATAKDPTFSLGLTVFSDDKDKTDGDGPYPNIEVPIKTVDATQAAALKARITGTKPSSSTPTLKVLQGQYAALEAFKSPGATDTKRVLVLLTDGVPDDGATEQAAVVKLAGDELKKTGPSGPISTFAVGIGNVTPLDPSTYDPRFMGDLAKAGGTANAGCVAGETTDVSKMCHFQVVPKGKTAAQIRQELIDALNRIRGAALSCEYALQKSESGAVDPSRVNVIFTDASGKETVIPQSGADGWSYDNPQSPTRVVVNGAACNQLKGDAKGAVKIVLGCKTVVK
ncbi:MAG: vWA domain-containing protein [Polyangiaceae bacterium]